MKSVYLTVLAFIVLYPLPLGGNQQQKPTDGNQANTEQANPQSKSAVTVYNNQAPAQSNEHPAESHPEQPTFFNADNGTWALVIVGILGTGAAVWTLLILSGQLREMRGAGQLMQRQLEQMQKQATEMESQTRHLEGSVNAAKISADIAARLSIPTLHIEKFEHGNMGAANLEATLQYPKVNIVIKNYGQTPAFLRSWNIIFTCGDLPPVPEYWTQPGQPGVKPPAAGIILERDVVQPNQPYTLPDLHGWQRTEIDLEDVQAIIDREKTLWVYGFVCYSDLFGNPFRRMKFCAMALNFEAGWVHWFDGLAPDAYRGIDDYPLPESTIQAMGQIASINNGADQES